jgi:hypothetical protein
MNRWIVGLAVIVLVGAYGPVAEAILINFESDTPGWKPNGFTSVDSPLVHFSDSSGSDLQVGDFYEAHGRGLGVWWDDPSFLIMDFDVPMTSISLDFGNDDPRWVKPGDQAILTLFMGALQVGQPTVVMNRDDMMNQSISFSGTAFDQATFFYDITTPPAGLIEVVDDIQLTPVPEPGGVIIWSLLAGLGMTVGWWRRRRAA